MMISPKRCWPTVGDFAFIRALSVVFPVTDYRHPIVTPAQLLLGEYLTSCPLRGPRDVVACLFTAQLLLEFVRDAKRIAPEVLIALEAIIGQCAMTLDHEESTSEPMLTCQELCAFSNDGVRLHQFDWLRRAISTGTETTHETRAKPTLPLSFLTYGEEKGIPTIGLSRSIVLVLFRIVDQVRIAMGDSPMSDIMFAKIHKGLLTLRKRISSRESSSKHAQSEGNVVSKPHPYIDLNLVDKIIDDLDDEIEQCKRARKPLRLRELAAEPIKTLTPDFQENYRWTKYGDEPDKRKAEMKKLKKQVARERKGVARELRRDAVFLSEQRQKEKQRRQDELREERRKNLTFLMDQAKTFNEAIKAGAQVKGGGSSGLDFRGQRR